MSLGINTLPVNTSKGFRISAWLFLFVYVTFIIYASIVPLGHWAMPAKPYPFDLLHGWQNRIHLFDIGQNLIFYAPLGLGIAILGYEKIHSFWLILLAFFISFGLSTLLESIQSFHTMRVSSLLDVILNSISGFWGAVVGWIFCLQRKGWIHLFNHCCETRHPFFLIVLAMTTFIFWTAYHLYPYLPTFQYSHLKYGMLPLIKVLKDPHLFAMPYFMKYFWQGMGLYLAGWVLFKPYFRIGILLLFAFSMLSVKVLIISRFISLESLTGLTAGIVSSAILATAITAIQSQPLHQGAYKKTP